MAAITYIEYSGESHTVDVEDGMSLMEGATLNMIPGIEGMCGGICSCATCHCFISLGDQKNMPPISEGEDAMLEGVSARRAESRLSCQIPVSDALDGLRIHLPEHQD